MQNETPRLTKAIPVQMVMVSAVNTGCSRRTMDRITTRIPNARFQPQPLSPRDFVVKA